MLNALFKPLSHPAETCLPAQVNVDFKREKRGWEGFTQCAKRGLSLQKFRCSVITWFLEFLIMKLQDVSYLYSS